MPDQLEEESQGLNLDRVLGMVRRRHLPFLIALFVGWAAVWGASWVLPPRYKSSTTIMVEEPSMPQDYVQPNVSDDLQARVQNIKTQLQSKTRLLMIIDRLHLYGGAKDPATEDARVEQMRDDFDVTLVRDPQRFDVTAFQISYNSPDPNIAQQVTRELADVFISENDKERQNESQGTTTFFEKQLEDARQNLADQEAKVHQYEAMHEGALPTQQASNLQILSGLQSQLESEEGALSTAKQQRVYLQALLEQQKASLSKVRPVSGPGAASSTPTDLPTVNEQLAKLQSQLDDLSSRYTEQYPDVVSLKHQIARLQAVRENLIAAAKARSKEPVPTSPTSIDDLDPSASAPMQQTQSQLQANQAEISNRENSISNLKARISDYQGRLNAEPATEQQLDDLNRGFTQSQANYDALLKKKDDSKMATSMEQMQQGERFITLDPPSLPTSPDFPNRLKFCGLGIGVGLLLGIAIAGGLEFMDDRIHTGKEIKALLPVAVISEIPEVVTVLDKKRAKRRITLGWVTTAFVMVTILAGSAYSYLSS
jgi:polysaccharide chain length determinant protein (PEP-CTERM system associated)